jgi:transcriptional regulator with XRE-family HTH domain
MDSTEVRGISPQFEMRHRMKLALEVSGVTVTEMAEHQGCNRVTVSGWLHGRSKPSTASLKLWAMVTGVDYRWLVSGEKKGTKR